MNRLRFIASGAALCIVAVSRTSVLAQTTDDINSALQFNFSNPGARSLAQAGAFTARADDATAAYANPAGLVQLSRPEIALEGRYWQYTDPFLFRGNTVAPAQLYYVYDNTDDRVSGVSFLSFNYPSKSGNWVVGGYVHQLANYQKVVHSDGVLIDGLGNISIRPIDGIYDLNVDTAGFSVAGKLAGNFSLGASLWIAKMKLDARTERHDAARGREVPNPNPFNESASESDGIFEENDATSLSAPATRICCQFADRGDIKFFETQHGDDISWSANVGALWRSTTKRGALPLVAVGIVYRRGPEFSFEAASYKRNTPLAPLPRRRAFLPVLGVSGVSAPWKGVFKVPDVIGLGVSCSPLDQLALSFDYNRIKYSQLLDKTLDITGLENSLGEVVSANATRIHDGNEYRLGAQYAIVSASGVSSYFLRVGVWSDPAHSTEYVGSSADFKALYPAGDDEIHYTGGFGLRFPRVQLDLALDLSQRQNTFSLSSVFYFGKD